MKRFIRTFDLLVDCFLVTGALYLVTLGAAWADRSLNHGHGQRQFNFSPEVVPRGAAFVCESDVEGGNGIIVPLKRRTQMQFGSDRTTRGESWHGDIIGLCPGGLTAGEALTRRRFL
jgi:hypothetical protein